MNATILKTLKVLLLKVKDSYQTFGNFLKTTSMQIHPVQKIRVIQEFIVIYHPVKKGRSMNSEIINALLKAPFLF